MIGLGCQLIEGELEEAQINAIGFVKGGRKILNDQEHIFVEAFSEMEVLTQEQQLELHKKKYFNKSKSRRYSKGAEKAGT